VTRVVTTLLPLALGVLLASACRSAPGEGAPATGAGDQPLAAADLAAIRANDSAFASTAEAGNAAGVAATYVPDAQLMPPNAPTIKGREAIQKFWGGLLGAYQLKFQVAADEVEGRGDLAYARGHYLLDGTPKAKGGAPIHDEGKFLEILRRQPDGTWRYAVDMYSSDLPAPGAK
jgi:ketosteroid isomerase-like protein